MKDRMSRRSKNYGFSYSLLPEFTDSEKAYIKGTYDFLGVNIYTAALVRAGNANPNTMGFFSDVEAILYQPPEWIGNGNFKVFLIYFLFFNDPPIVVQCLLSNIYHSLNE